jgi:membrane protein
VPDEQPQDSTADDDARDVIPASQAASEPGRGRDASSPKEMPPKGWRDVLTRVKAEVKDDHVTLLSAGIAFYTLLAAVPALVAIISIYALVADPADVSRQVVDSLAAAPQEVRQLVQTQLESIVADSGGSTALAAIIGIVVALWSASAGIGHLMDALNVAYDEREQRSFVRRKLVALAFTIGAIVFVVVAFGLIAVMPAILADTGLGVVGRVLANVLRWVVLLAGMVVGLAVIYRYGPDRDQPRWRWTSPGAIVAAVLWVVGSLLFSVYTANFAKYNETYGSLGAIIVVMLWLFLTALVVIVGAELNAELERQTVEDTTAGPSKPLGERDAHAADTVGAPAEQIKASR